MKVTAGILAIGDEVVQGQITNRNASWLATELEKINITTYYHLSCRDHESDIIHALEFLSNHCTLILVCGGLGPTRDDCTRATISDWLGKPLYFNEPIWKEIEQKLSVRQVTIREGHRNQSYFPEDTQVLKNIKGVAPGFYIQKKSLFLAALPGPPSELKSMFNDELLPQIKKSLSPENSQKLYAWLCIGAPESELAHITESLLGTEKDFRLGYRIHKPYVEIKVWGPKKLNSSQEKKIHTLEEKIKPWFISHSLENIRKAFHHNLSRFEGIYVIDHLTSGLLLEKLQEFSSSDHLRYQCFEHKSFRHFSKEEVLQIYKHMGGGPQQLFIFLFPYNENSALLCFNKHCEIIEIPRNFPLKSHIGQLFAVESVFIRGNKMLSQ